MGLQAKIPSKQNDSLRYLALIGFGLLVMLLFLGLEWSATGGISGVPLDDSWIHFRFADNLRAGDGFAFNPGNPTPGSTSPLWVGMLSLIDLGFILPSKIIGILAYLAASIVIYRIARWFNLRWYYALLAGLGTLAAGRFAWAAPSGMETTAFTFISLLALWSWTRAPKGEIPWYTSLLFGAACLLRPEGYLLLGLSGIVYLIEMADRDSWWKQVRVLAKHFLISGLVILPYLLFSLLTAGHILPNTFYVKRSAWDCQPSLAYFAWIGAVFWFDNIILASLSVFGVAWILRSGYWRVKRGLLLSCLWVVSLPLLYGIMAPCTSGYYTRYTTALIPIVMMLGAFGGQELEARIRFRVRHRKEESKGTRKRSRLMRLILFEGILLAMIPTTFFWAPFFAQNVADIQDMHVRIGNWLALESERSDLIALNDIGAIGFIADREVIDLMGLVTPEVIEFVEEGEPGKWDAGLAAYIQERQPSFLVIFPNWFPEMISLLPVERIYSIRLADRAIAGIPGLTMVGGGEMVVYRLHWQESKLP
jgi:hypothetical protein